MYLSYHGWDLFHLLLQLPKLFVFSDVIYRRCIFLCQLIYRSAINSSDLLHYVLIGPRVQLLLPLAQRELLIIREVPPREAPEGTRAADLKGWCRLPEESVDTY